MALATVICWINSMNFLRPFNLTGPLVIMIFTVVVEIVPFFIILALVLFGFSQAFYLLMANNNDETLFNSIQSAYLHSFSYMMGSSNYDLSAGVDSETDMFKAIVVIFITFVQILLLNLLIAFLNYVYSGIQVISSSYIYGMYTYTYTICIILQANAKVEGLRQRCKIIVNQIWPTDRLGHKWVHFLKKNDDVLEDEAKATQAELTSVRLKHDLEEKIKAVATELGEQVDAKLEGKFKELQELVKSLGKSGGGGKA